MSSVCDLIEAWKLILAACNVMQTEMKVAWQLIVLIS